MKKYIIKNCPARIFEHIGSKQSCFDTQDEDERYTLCKDVFDCPLKQLYEKMKECNCELINFLEIEEVNE